MTRNDNNMSLTTILMCSKGRLLNFPRNFRRKQNPPSPSMSSALYGPPPGKLRPSRLSYSFRPVSKTSFITTTALFSSPTPSHPILLRAIRQYVANSLIPKLAISFQSSALSHIRYQGRSIPRTERLRWKVRSQFD